MPIEHTKEYGVYRWDTFDNETILVHEADNYQDALHYILEVYEEKLSPTGADRVEIVDSKGNVINQYSIK